MCFFRTQTRSLQTLKKYVRSLYVLDKRDVFKEIYRDSTEGADLGGEHIVELAPQFVVARFHLRPEYEPQKSALLPIITELILEQYEASWVLNILKVLNTPIPLELELGAYYGAMARQIAQASAARVVLLRLYDEHGGSRDRDKLTCQAVFDEKQERSVLRAFNVDKEKSAAFPFYNALAEDFANLHQELVVLRKSSDHEHFKIAAEYLTGVEIETMIFGALTYRGELLGFLTMAYEENVDLTDSLKPAFSNMTHHAAIAIENRRQVSEISNIQTPIIKEYMAKVHIDLIQGFRHSARNALMLAQGYISSLEAFYQYKGDQQNNPLRKLANALGDIDTAFNNMAALKELSEGKEDVDIFDVFDDACALMKSQLDVEGIEVKRTPKGKLLLSLNRDAVKSAFANLILNSIQAFQESHIRQGARHIALTGWQSGHDVIVEYSDDGPGIRLGQGDIKQRTDIWEAGKSSKRSGTGYGMPLVRQVFQTLHNGSIDLRDTNRGVLFRIRLHTDGE